MTDEPEFRTRPGTVSGADAAGNPHLFRGQPWWVLASLSLIVVAAATLYTWNIGFSGLSTYYAASVKSMLANPNAAFFGTMDPNATITLDKLAGFLLPQALSAKIFGFHAWALSLPQAVEGLVTVVASYVIGARWRGPAFGLAASAIMAFTPTLAAMFGRPMEDGLLTMCMVLAFAAWQRALVSGSMLWLSLAGVWVAVGFQAKMLQAWLILPALLIAYLIASPLPLRRRIGQLAVAGAVTLVLSLSWMTAIQLVPVSERPYIDGTTSNNVYSMVFGYNGVDRLVPGLVPGAVSQLDASTASATAGSVSPSTELARSSPAKLVLPQFSTQIGWLYPAAVAGSALEILALRKRRTPAGGVGLAAVLWLILTGGVLSVAFVPHATYFAVLAFPLAALAVSGAVGAVKLYGRRTAEYLLLPGVVIAQTLWASWIADTAAVQLRWLAPIILAVGLSASTVLIWMRVRRAQRLFLVRGALAGASVAALLGPVIWSVCVLGPGGGGSAGDAFAGPRLAASGDAARPGGVRLRPPFLARADPGLDPEQRRLAAYIDSRNATGSISFATDTLSVAVGMILSTHESPLPMGGFSQRAPAPTPTHLRNLIESGHLRFVLLAVRSAGQPAPANPTLDDDRAWVRANCIPTITGQFADRGASHQVLFDCKPGSAREPAALRTGDQTDYGNR